MPIENVERFHCHLCNFTTYDRIKIAYIKKFNLACPACQDGKGKAYFRKGHHTSEEINKIVKEIEGE